uniref:Uncharacterized protein n=1 Tax=Anguilla anguilla TaxID=7936 RepID=A0A0E9T9X5_ANGAN
MWATHKKTINISRLRVDRFPVIFCVIFCLSNTE